MTQKKKTTPKRAPRARASLSALRALEGQNMALAMNLKIAQDQKEARVASLLKMNENLARERAVALAELSEVNRTTGPTKEAIQAYKVAQADKKAAEEALIHAKQVHETALEALKKAKEKMTGEFWDTVNPPEMVTVRKDSLKSARPTLNELLTGAPPF